MHDLPTAFDLTTANSGAHPDVSLFAIGPRSGNSIEAVAEGYVITRSDAQIANLVADRISKRREPRFPVFSVCIGAVVLERRREVEHHDVSCVVGHDAVDIL